MVDYFLIGAEWSVGIILNNKIVLGIHNVLKHCNVTYTP